MDNVNQGDDVRAARIACRAINEAAFDALWRHGPSGGGLVGLGICGQGPIEELTKLKQEEGH